MYIIVILCYTYVTYTRRERHTAHTVTARMPESKQNMRQRQRQRRDNASNYYY